MTSTSDTPEGVGPTPATETVVASDAPPPVVPPAEPAKIAPPEPEVAPAAPRPARAPVLVVVVSILALLVGVGALVRPELQPPPPAVSPTTLDGRLAPLDALPAAIQTANAKVEALTREVATLRNAPPPAAPSVDTTGLEAATARADAAEKAVADLARRLQTLEDTVKSRNEGSRGAEAGALAAGLLRRAADGERPFLPELRLSRALVGDDAESARLIDAVAPRAETGVPTMPVLAERFRAVESAIVRAARSKTDGDWWDRALTTASNLVTARRITGAEEGSVDAIVTRIEGALKAGDASAALAQAEKLGEAPADVAVPWIADLRARAALDQAADGLSRRAVERLAGALGVEIGQ